MRIDHLTDRKLLDENRNREQDNCVALSLVDVDGGVTIIEVVHAKAWVQLVCTKAIKKEYISLASPYRRRPITTFDQNEVSDGTLDQKSKIDRGITSFKRAMRQVDTPIWV